jgi:competence CoiA-like predicted nuclease
MIGTHAMPLKCQSPHGEEYSFRHASESWTALKALNATEHHLAMPCCGARVVLKRSRRGTQFFAHARRGDCTTAPESEQHLLAKDIIARAGETLGWQVTTEQRGMSPTGDSWIADVLCRNPKSQKAIAFEVQWSPRREGRICRERFPIREG